MQRRRLVLLRTLCTQNAHEYCVTCVYAVFFSPMLPRTVIICIRTLPNKRRHREKEHSCTAVAAKTDPAGNKNPALLASRTIRCSSIRTRTNAHKIDDALVCLCVDRLDLPEKIIPRVSTLPPTETATKIPCTSNATIYSNTYVYIQS